MGQIYGYSTDDSGYTNAVIGKALKFTYSGKVTLEVISSITGLWMAEPRPGRHEYKKKVSVKAMKLFPIHVEYLK